VASDSRLVFFHFLEQSMKNVLSMFALVAMMCCASVANGQTLQDVQGIRSDALAMKQQAELTLLLAGPALGEATNHKNLANAQRPSCTDLGELAEGDLDMAAGNQNLDRGDFDAASAASCLAEGNNEFQVAEAFLADNDLVNAGEHYVLALHWYDNSRIGSEWAIDHYADAADDFIEAECHYYAGSGGGGGGEIPPGGGGTPPPTGG
jgi:hypothetical protein